MLGKPPMRRHVLRALARRSRRVERSTDVISYNFCPRRFIHAGKNTSPRIRVHRRSDFRLMSYKNELGEVISASCLLMSYENEHGQKALERTFYMRQIEHGHFAIKIRLVL